MGGKIQDKMLACKKRLVAGDYTILVIPVGERGKYRFPSSYSRTNCEYTTYYWWPCFNGMPLSLTIQVKDDSHKPSGGFKYNWKLFYVEKGKQIPVDNAEGTGYLTLYEEKIPRNEITLASEHVLSPGQYTLKIQMHKRDETILNWYSIANFGVFNWDFALGLIVGLIGTIITIVIEVILAILKR